MKRALALLFLCALSACVSVSSQPIRFGYRAAPEMEAPLRVTFEANVPSGSKVTWDFGDGRTATVPNPELTFYRPGTYRVRVEVENAGRRASGTITVEAKDAGPERAEVTLLHAGTGAVFSAARSRVYAPFAPLWNVDGATVNGEAKNLRDGTHVLRLRVQGVTGAHVRELRFETGRVNESAAYELEVLRLTNDARARGWNCDTLRFGGSARPPLRRDARLDVAARAQTHGMALGGYFDHVSPIDGSAPRDRIVAAGYDGAAFGENIAVGQTSPAEVVTAWLRSKGHCRAIMGEFQHLGLAFGERRGSQHGTYWAQTFGSL